LPELSGVDHRNASLASFGQKSRQLRERLPSARSVRVSSPTQDPQPALPGVVGEQPVLEIEDENDGAVTQALRNHMVFLSLTVVTGQTERRAWRLEDDCRVGVHDNAVLAMRPNREREDLLDDGPRPVPAQ
jgi:hypothetical protein